MKKYLSALILSIANISVALAGGVVAIPFQPRGSFYIGTFLSQDRAHFDTKKHADFTATPDFYTPVSFKDSYNYDWNADGVNGGLFIGYNYLVTPILSFSAEFFGDFSGLSGKFTGGIKATEPPMTIAYSHLDSKMRILYTFGFSVLPGVKVNPFTTLFGRVGWVYSEFEFTNNARMSGELIQLPGRSLDTTKHKSGVQVGVGMGTSAFHSNFSVRLEYDWAFYGRISNAVGPVMVGLDNFDNETPIYYTANARMDPIIEQFKIGLTYHFGNPYTPHEAYQFAIAHHLSGFYVGGFVSRDLANFDTTANHKFIQTFGPGDTTDFSHSVNFDWNATGIDGGLFIGYNLMLGHRYMLGAELSGDISSLIGRFHSEYVYDPTYQAVEVNSKVRTHYTLGASLLPGIMLNSSTNLFFRIGWVNSKFSYSAASRFIDFNSLAIAGEPLHFENNKSGIEFGVGLVTLLSNHIGLRMEYDWSYYGDIGKSIGPRYIGKVFDSQVAGSASVKLHPMINQFKVALIRYFSS